MSRLSLRARCIPLLILLLLSSLLVACNLPAYKARAEAQPTATYTPLPPPPTAYQFPEGYQTPTPFEPVYPIDYPTPSLTPTLAPIELATALPVLDGIPTPFPVLSGEETINFLMIGSDKRSNSIAYRTDTLIIVSVRPKDGSVTLISIPRDLYVYIPGWQMNRINTAYFHGEYVKAPGGGLGLLKETILYNLGIRIDHMAMVDFDGFRQVVDTLGGIDLPLACPYTDWRLKKPNLDEEIESNWELYTAGPGVVHMDGDLALWYARSRSRSNDFDRGRRQQEVLRALYMRGLQLNVIPRLPEMYATFQDTVITDVSLQELLALAPLAARLDAPRIRSYYIHNKLVQGWWTPGGAAVLLPKGEAIRAMITEAMGPPDAIDLERLSLVVEVVNGTNNSGWDQMAAERLHYAGYETHLLDDEQTAALISSFDIHQTTVIDLSVDQDQTRSAALLAILGLPQERLRSAPEADSPVAFRLVLGPDYRPCFNPSALSH